MATIRIWPMYDTTGMDRSTAAYWAEPQLSNRLGVDIERWQTRLEATSGPRSRRRHRDERNDLRFDAQRAVGEVARIGGLLPGLDERLGRLRSDQTAEDARYQRRAEAATRWRGLRNEANRRIDRRVQAAVAAPTLAGYAGPPADLGAGRAWWESASEVERRRLWDGLEPARGAGPRSGGRPQEPQDGSASSLGVRPDVVDMLGRVDAAAAAAERRRERQRERAARRVDAAHKPLYAALRHQETLAQQQPPARGPVLSP